MTLLLFTGFGASLSGCLLHGVLGFSRPVDRKHLVFSAVLAALCAYFLFERRFYAAASVDEVVRIARAEYPFTSLYFALFGWFIVRYTGLRVPRAVAVAYYALIAAALVYDYLAPWGFYYTTPPRIVTVESFGGETIHMPVARLGAVPVLYYLLFLVVQATGIVGGILLARRGARTRGIIFAVAVGLPMVAGLVDLVHELIGADWPYVTEFGMVGLSLILSAQLAVDFREKERELAGAFADLKEHAARTALLMEVTWVLSQMHEHERALENLAKLCLGDLADWCVIDLKEGERLHRAAAAPEGAVCEGPTEREAETILGTGAPIFRASGANGHSLLVPLAAGGRLLGVLTVGSHRPLRYGDVERALVEEIAGRAALAIENARLAELDSRALERVARLALAIKDMANTPLQVLNLGLELVRDPGQVATLARMRRAVRQLHDLDTALTAYSARIRWRKEEESFDPAQVIANGVGPRGGDERSRADR